jgi:hypothetical protein
MQDKERASGRAYVEVRRLLEVEHESRLAPLMQRRRYHAVKVPAERGERHVRRQNLQRARRRNAVGELVQHLERNAEVGLGETPAAEQRVHRETQRERARIIKQINERDMKGSE